MNDEWVETTLGDIATWGAGSTPKAGDPKFYDGGNIPWAVIADVQDEYISITEKYITEEGLRKIGHSAPEGSVLVTMYGTIGRVAITTRPMATNQAIAWAIPDTERVSAEFLFHWLRNYQPELDKQARGATQRNINRAILRDSRITLPPLPVQRRIVDLMTHIDAHIAKLQAERTVTQALLQSARESLLTENDNWTNTSLADLTLKIGSGATPRGGEASYRDEGIALIRSQNIYDFRFAWDGLARIGPEQAALLDGVEVKPADLLLNITGASVNRCCEVPLDALPARVNQHVAIIRCDPDVVHPRFLLHMLRRSDLRAELDGMAGAGTTRQALTKVQIEQFRVSIPDLPNQERIAFVLDSLVTNMNSLDGEVTALTQMRSALLESLLSGGSILDATYDAFLGEAS